MLLFILSLCGFSGALATRLLDPLITTIATDFATSVGVVALLSSAFALPFGLSQPFLGPTGDAFGKAVVIKVAVAVLALCLLASALAPNLTVLFITRVLGGVAAGGIMPVCMAMIGDSFPLAVPAGGDEPLHRSDADRAARRCQRRGNGSPNGSAGAAFSGVPPFWRRLRLERP
jgi:MFS family permease